MGGAKGAVAGGDILVVLYGGDGLGGFKGYNSVTGPTLSGAGSINPGIRAIGTGGLVRSGGGPHHFFR